MYASEAKKSEFLVHLDCFSKYLKYFKIFEKWYTSFWAKLGYSRIKIDHIADSLLKLQIRIGVHLINVELSQLLTLIDWKTLTELNCCWLENGDCWTSYYWTFCFGKSKKKQRLWSFLLHDLPRCLQKKWRNCLIL